MSNEYRDLGMRRRIARRDFLNGIALAVGSAAAARTMALDAFGWRVQPQPAGAQPLYPPAATGLRGNYQAAIDAFAPIQRGAYRNGSALDVDTRERYDLVIVGGGISGLAAAYFWRKALGPEQRVLVLDNHDDFGGHAKRNEFQYNGRTFIGYGGTQSIPTPYPYSYTAKRLIEDLGIAVERNNAFAARDAFQKLNLGAAMLFDKEHFGADRLVAGNGRLPWPAFFAAARHSVGPIGDRRTSDDGADRAGAALVRAARRVEVGRAHSVEERRGAGIARARARQRRVPARRQGSRRQRPLLHPRLLRRADTGADAGAARPAEGRARVSGQGADDVQQHPRPALDRVSETRRLEHHRAGDVSRGHQPRSGDDHRRLPRRHDAGGVDHRADGEKSQQAGAAAARAAPRGTAGAPLDDLRAVRARDPPSAGAHARRRWIRSGGRHRRHHGQPMAVWIRVHIRHHRRSRRAAGAAAARDRASAFRPRRDREC